MQHVFKYTSEWFVGLVLRCIPFDITTQNELNKLKCVNTFVPTSCRVSCDLEVPLYLVYLVLQTLIYSTPVFLCVIVIIVT